MKNQKKILWLVSLLLVVVMAACTSQPTSQPTEEPAATEPAVAEPATSEATVAATDEPSATPTAEPTATTEPTATIMVEPTATSEAAAQVVAPVTSGSEFYLSLSANTVCRTGPATVYQSVGTIPAGLRVKAVGRLADDDVYYYIENPNDPSVRCWVFGQGASLEGDRSSLPKINALPSPTPDSGMNFTVTYSTVKICNGDDYSFSFTVKNTDDLVWQSIKVYIVDPKTGATANYSSDRFEESLNCQIDNYQNDLAKGERAYITPYHPGHFDYNVYGHTFLLRVTLCSEDGLAGTCMTREVQVQP